MGNLLLRHLALPTLILVWTSTVFSADSVDVVFRYASRKAQHVTVAGSFNGWNPSVDPLTKSETSWILVKRLPLGYYDYKLVVDGHWITDPKNPEKINDGGDGFNSILKVGEPPRPTRKSRSEPLPEDRLPLPVLDGNPEFVELWKAAWRIAWNKIAQGTPENGFASEYMDEGFNEQVYQWDSCFMSLFAIYGCDVFPAMAALDNFYSKQRADGYIQRVYEESTGLPVTEPTADEPLVNPPLFAWAEAQYYHITGDSSRISRILPVLIRYFEWIETNCRTDKGKGLLYTTPLGSGMDNTPRPGVGKAGWVDFSSQQAFAARCISELADVTGDTAMARVFQGKHAELATTINSLCWNEINSFYYDLREDGRLSVVDHIGGFWPMKARIAEDKKISMMISLLLNPRYFARPHMIPTLSWSDSCYDPKGHYWRGSVWAPTNYMVVSALNDNGYPELADQIAVNHLTNMAQVLNSFIPDEKRIAFEERYGDGYRTIWECYSAEEPEPATRWDNTFYSRQDFVGWSGLGPIAMLIENVLGINVIGYQNTISWWVHRTDRHGIERLRLRDQRISLIYEPSSAGAAVRVRAEAPFMLELIRGAGYERFEITPGDTVLNLN